jgi:hypothetical protein
MTRATLSSLALAALLVGCGTEPVYTAFEATLVSPHNLEGSAVIELDGEYPDAITAISGQAFTHADNGVTRVVIVLYDPGSIGFVLNLDVAGNSPTARVIEVADASNQLRPSLSEYSINFEGVGQ